MMDVSCYWVLPVSLFLCMCMIGSALLVVVIRPWLLIFLLLSFFPPPLPSTVQILSSSGIATMSAVAKKTTKRPAKKVAKKVSRKSPEYTTVRRSCKPGAIAIILAGRFRGRRAVILKQLPGNGPLVISGPMKYSGVPIRRIDSRYIIATSTKVDIKNVDTSAITADLFKRPKQEKRVKSEEEFMGDKAKRMAEQRAKKTAKAAPKGTVSDARAQLQKKIDAALIDAIKKDPLGKEKAGYLHSVFTLKPGDVPHRMKW